MGRHQIQSIQHPSRAIAVIHYIWSGRRWAYAYMLLAVLWIPTRVGFRLAAPICDIRLTLANASMSMTKVPHFALFAIFFVLTALQFEELKKRALGWSVFATIALGLLVELEEGASRTGNCRLTDVLPDAAGGLIAGTAVVGVIMLRDCMRCRKAGSE
jgi:hypothetical protein